MARPTERGEVWLAQMDKLRPVVIASRNDLNGVRARATVAMVTTTVRGIPSEVALDHRDGFPKACVINCDDLATIDKARLRERRGSLSTARIAEFDEALRFALAVTQ
ncbi:MAG: type II toxin-antitoxin system PemK/MazF family toxin [Chloroflexota bacterium]|nr:type II toxin-antitoxin system PemK/MazF family toxin [Chloroflexota bacterium]